MVKHSVIEDAFFFVSSAGYGMHSAILNKSTGRLYFRSDIGDLDEISAENPDWDMSIEIPHKNDLGLGQELVFEFDEKYLPDDLHQVHLFFRKQGAYHRFKRLLATKGLLQNWYDFENQCAEQALRQWCEGNEIELSGEHTGAADQVPSDPCRVRSWSKASGSSLSNSQQHFQLIRPPIRGSFFVQIAQTFL